jgi:hypothetical protein
MIYRTPKHGTHVTFLDHQDPEDTTLLPDPRFLRLHAAVAGIINMSGTAEYIETYVWDLQETCVLAANGATPIMTLFTVHSLNKASMIRLASAVMCSKVFFMCICSSLWCHDFSD